MLRRESQDAGRQFSRGKLSQMFFNRWPQVSRRIGNRE